MFGKKIMHINNKLKAAGIARSWDIDNDDDWDDDYDAGISTES